MPSVPSPDTRWPRRTRSGRRGLVVGALVLLAACAQATVGQDAAVPPASDAAVDCAAGERCVDTKSCGPGGGNCGSNDGGLDDGGLNGGTDGAMPPLAPALQERIDDAVGSIQSDTCFAQGDISMCQWADYEVGPDQFDMARSTGEAILVIDDFGAGLFPNFVRYRNRLLGFYRIDGDNVEAQVLSVHLPKRLGDVLVSFAGPEFIPASALTRVAMAAGPVYKKLNLLYLGHSGVVFGHLVDLVPEQPLVLLDMAHLLELPPVFCQGIDSQTLAAARLHVAAIAASLKQVMTDLNVRFVNASFGSTAPLLAVEWSRTCGGAIPSSEQLQQLLHVQEPIYDLLFNSPGVITAHAAVNRGSPADFPFDQASAQYPNRVRVGFISSLSSGLDEVGRGTVQKAEQFPADGDADVYLNWGCQVLGPCADPHYQLTGLYGLGTGTVPLMSSSYINPLALARLVNLRYANHQTEPMSNALVQTLEHELTPSLCGAGGGQPYVYQDPILHHQLEPYRLQYE
jgi:hypothetical protein